MATLRDLAPGLPQFTTLGDLAPGVPGLRPTETPTNYTPDPTQLERRIARDDSSEVYKGYRSGRASDQANWLANEEALRAAAGDTAGAAAIRRQIEGHQQEAAFWAPKEQDVTQLDWDPGRIWNFAKGAVGSVAASAQDGVLSGAALRGASAVTGFVPTPVTQGISKALGVASYAVPFATNYLSNAGETYNEMARDPELMNRTTATERLLAGAGTGLAMGALDTIGDVGLIRRGLGGTFGKTVDKALDSGGVVARTAKDSLLEGGTEIAQTGLQKTTLGLLNPDRDTSGDSADYWNALAQGTIGSVPLSGTANTIQAVRETIQNRTGEEADRAAGSKRGDEIDLTTGKTISGRDVDGETLLRAAATAGTKFSPEQQARRDLIDGTFEVSDDPNDLAAKTFDRHSALLEELSRYGNKPEAAKLIEALVDVDPSDPLANDHPAMKAAADYVRPYAGMTDEQLKKAIKSVGGKERKLSTYVPADDMGGKVGDAGGIDTSKMAPADQKKFAARQVAMKQIEDNGKNAAGLLEYARTGGQEGKRAPVAERKAFRAIGDAIATMAHIKGEPSPGQLFTAERYGRILGSMLRGVELQDTLIQVGRSTGAEGSALFSALTGAAVRSAGQLTRASLQQEKLSRDAAAEQMVALIPKNTLTALTNKGVNLQGDDNQRQFMLDGLESFFQDGDGPFTEAKLTAMLGKETLGKLKELFDAPIEPNFESDSIIDDRADAAAAAAEDTVSDLDDFEEEGLANALDKSAPERLLFSHGAKDNATDARGVFRQSVAKVREAVKKGLGLSRADLPSLARLPQVLDDGSWDPQDMLFDQDPEAKDLVLPMSGDNEAVLPANSKLWRVAKYALDKFATGKEDEGFQPSHAVRLSSATEEMDADRVPPETRTDMMLGYLVQSKKLSDDDGKKLLQEVQRARATKIAADKVNAILTDKSTKPLRERAAAKLAKGELNDIVSRLSPEGQQRVMAARQGSSEAERLRTTLLALAKELKVAQTERAEAVKNMAGLVLPDGDVDAATKAFFDERFMVVAEQKTNRDFDRMTALDVDKMIEGGQARLDAARGQVRNIANEEKREQARRKILAEEGTILFLKDGVERAIRATDLVAWSRNALFSTVSEDNRKAIDLATRKGYLNHLSQGIAALVDSGQVPGAIYTYGWTGRLGKESERVARRTLLGKDGKQHEFPDSFPVAAGTKTTTFGRIRFGQEKRSERRKGDGQLVDPMERSLLDEEGAADRSDKAAAEFKDGEREPGDTNEDGYYTSLDRNEGLQRDQDERDHLKRTNSITMAAKEAKPVKAEKGSSKSIAPAPDVAPSESGQNRTKTKGPDGKFVNPVNPEPVLNPEQAKADQRRVDDLEQRLAELTAKHPDVAARPTIVQNQINKLGRELLELEKRGVTGPKAADIKPAKAEAPAVGTPSTPKQRADTGPIQKAADKTVGTYENPIIGDLWAQDGVKVVSTNLGGVHGRGLAMQAREKGLIGPKHKDFDSSPMDRGVITLAVKGNAPETAKVPGRPFSEQVAGKNIDLLKSELRKLVRHARANPGTKFYLPYVGLGFGEGDAAVIGPILAIVAKEPNIFMIAKDQKTVEQYAASFQPGVRQDSTTRGAPAAKAETKTDVQVREHPGSGYAARTKHNVDAADVTVAIADDPNTAGEMLTRRLAGPKFFGIEYGLEDPTEVAEKLAAFMKARGATSLNIAGNGIYTLYNNLGATQAEVNQEVYDIIAALHAIHPISKIVSGGQTGVDIAGAVAAKALGIPAEITLPKGYRQRNEKGEDFTQTRADVGKQIVDGAAALDRGDRKLSTYAPDAEATENTAQAAQDPVTRPAPSDSDLERVRAHLTRMLGDKIKVVFEKVFDAQGEWIEADKTIKLAIGSIMPMLSTANHEALHAFFSGVLANNPAARELLLGLVQDPRHLDRLEGILAKGKDGNKAAIASMRSSPEEALAYTFQFWAEGLLPIDKKPQGVLQKIQRFLREVFGLVRDSEKALDIFQALYDGKMAEPSAAQKALDGIMAQGERGKQWRQKRDAQVEWLRSTAMTSHYMMRNSASATMRDIAAKFFTNPGSTKLGTDPGILNRRDTENKRWATEFQLIVNGLSEEDLASMAKHDNERKWEDHPDPGLNKRLKALYALNNRFRTEYLLPAGIELGMRDVQVRADGSEDHRYTPMVWDVQELYGKKDEFSAMLKQEKYATTMGELLATMRQSKPDAEMDDVIDAIFQLLVDRNGVEEAGKLDAQREDGVLSPFFAAENVRKLDWIDPIDRGPFLSKDLIYKMSSYLHQGVRAAEYVRTWGAGGKVLRDLLVRKGDTIGFDKDGPIRAPEDGPYMKELREAAAKEKVPEDQVEAWVQRRYEDETRAVGAQEGVLGKDISDNMRKLNSGLTAYQNARLLPLAIFASMLDPNNILVSGGKLDDMIYGYIRGMKAVFRNWKNLATGTELMPETDRDALNAMAVGAIDNNVFLEQKGHVQQSEYMTTFAHKFNNKFFLINGLTMWDRQMRITATRAGMAFIERNVRGEDTDSERKLKALGLTADQVVLGKDGKLVVDPKALATERAAKKAGEGWAKATPEQRRQWALNQLPQAREDLRPQQDAVKRFVNRGVLSPNAAQRPAWASDPHYASLFHLKSFTYSFQETVLTHAAEEAQAGNFRPGMQLLAGIPIMIAADITKALITGGGSLPGYMANWTVADWVLHGFSRAGLGGIGEIGVHAMGDPTSLLGPSIDQVYDTVTNPGEKFGNLDMIPGLRILRPGLDGPDFVRPF